MIREPPFGVINAKARQDELIAAMGAKLARRPTPCAKCGSPMFGWEHVDCGRPLSLVERAESARQRERVKGMATKAKPPKAPKASPRRKR